jgi:hypothetical protein
MAASAAFLHEKIAAAPPDLAAEGLALAVTIGGIVILAQRAPLAAQHREPAGTAGTSPAAAVGTAGARPGAAAGRGAVLVAFRRHDARADPAGPRARDSSGRRRAEGRRVSPPTDHAALGPPPARCHPAPA